MKTPPKYLKLQADIKNKIDRGVYPAGSRLPSVRKMATEHGLGVITVLRAYEELKAEGWLDSSERAGFFARAAVLSETPLNPLIKPQIQDKLGMDFQAQVIEANRNPKLIAFGGSSLDPGFLPFAELKSCQLRAARRFGPKFFSYEALGGMLELRREIAKRATLWGGTFTEEECIVTAGATEAIALALQAVTRPGDTVAVESPTYFGILTILNLLGLRALEIPSDANRGPDPVALESVMKKKTISACVLIPNFQNPSGSLIPDEIKKAIARMARRYECPVIECDTSSDLFLEGARPKPIQSFSDDGWVLSVQSFSKLVAPGLRVGYLVPGRFLATTKNLKRGLSLATGSGPQLALSIFLREGGYERHLRRLRTQFRILLPRWVEAVRCNFPAETRISRPAGGYLLWIQLPRKVDGRKLWREALECGISISPGELFSGTGRYGDYIRLNCAIPMTDKALRGMEMLGRLASSGR